MTGAVRFGPGMAQTEIHPGIDGGAADQRITDHRDTGSPVGRGESGLRDAATSLSSGGHSMSDLENRLDRPESLVEQQQETIQEQRERIAELEAENDCLRECNVELKTRPAGGDTSRYRRDGRKGVADD